MRARIARIDGRSDYQGWCVLDEKGTIVYPRARGTPAGKSTVYPRGPRRPAAEAARLSGAATTGSVVEIEEGELMTVVETTAVRSVRVVLTSRASS